MLSWRDGTREREKARGEIERGIGEGGRCAVGRVYVQGPPRERGFERVACVRLSPGPREAPDSP